MRVKASANTGTVTRNKVRPPSELDVAVAAVVRRSCSNPRKASGHRLQHSSVRQPVEQ